MTAPRESARRSPVVLVVDDQDWSTRSLESVLTPHGYAVLSAFTGAKGLEQAGTHAPDVVVVARRLPDTDGLELCRALRDAAVLGERVPLFLAFTERPTRAERLAAFRAGAWDVLVPPIDAEELVLRLQAYVRAKLDADRTRDTGLLDPRTGLYNRNGLERRAAELGALAQRQGGPLSCVILGFVSPAGAANQATLTSAGRVGADVLRTAGRTSDTIGRIGQAEFAVLALGADAPQAVQLAERFAAALRAAGVLTEAGERSVWLRGGYDSVADARETPLTGPELIARAAMALAHAKAEGEWLKPFRLR